MKIINQRKRFFIATFYLYLKIRHARLCFQLQNSALHKRGWRVDSTIRSPTEMFININGGEPIQRVYECWFSEQLQDKTRATMLCATTVHFYGQGKTFHRAFIHLSCSRIKTIRWIVPTSSWLEISLRTRRNIVHLDAGLHASDNSPIKRIQTIWNPFTQNIYQF